MIVLPKHATKAQRLKALKLARERGERIFIRKEANGHVDRKLSTYKAQRFLETGQLDP